MYGYYTHPTAGPDGEPVVVRLLANPEDKERYEAEGFVYLGEAPPPGTSTPEEEEKALAQAQREAARKAERAAKPDAEPKVEEAPASGGSQPSAPPERTVPRSSRA